MGLNKEAKEREARMPDKHIDQSHDQVFDQDANPKNDNLVNKAAKVTSGRNLPNTQADSAPTSRRITR